MKPSMMSPPSSKRSSGSSDGVTSSARTVDAYVSVLETKWEFKHPMSKVKPNLVQPAMVRQLYTANTWKHSPGDTVNNATNFLPAVTIRGMPATRYPEYMGFLVRATLVAAVEQRPALANALSDSSFVRLATIAVAVRCGMWASMNLLPVVATEMSPAVVMYDVKRNRLWEYPKGWGTSASMWSVIRARATTRLVEEAEIMGQLCIVAPMFALMACVLHVRKGEVYAQPYVEQSISACIKRRMNRDAYAALSLDKEVTWEIARDSAILGMPTAAVRAWATDSLLAVGAQIRLTMSSAEKERFERRERTLMEGANTMSTISNFAVGADDVDDDDDPIAAEWRAIREKVGAIPRDDDEMTMPTQFGAMPSRPPTPDAPARTVVPSRSHTPPAPLTAEAIGQIRDAVRDAHSGGERAASEIMGATDDDTVKW